MSSTKISVVICTHRRFDLLESAVQSLCIQSAPKELYEVIIVDNDITSNVQVINLVNLARRKINIRYIHEPVLGLSQARNTGGKDAISDYVAYLDDDAKVHSGYISIASKIIDEVKPDIFGGPFIAFYLSQKPYWFKDEYGSSDNKDYRGFLNQQQYVYGMNMCFNRLLLEKIGWFDKNLGMSGKKIWYGEETMIQIKAWQDNPSLKVWFDKDLYVEHLVSDQRMRLMDQIIRRYSLGNSQAYLWLRNQDIKIVRKKAPKVLLKTLAYLILKGLPGMLFFDSQKYPFWQNYVYEDFSKYFASIGQEWRYTIDLLNHRKII